MSVEALQNVINFLIDHKLIDTSPATPVDPLTQEALKMYRFLTSNGPTESLVIAWGKEEGVTDRTQ